MRIANDSRYVVGRLCSIGFHPIFRIEGTADRLDPEDWIPVACESGIPLAKLSHTVQPTHTNPGFTIANNMSTIVFQWARKVFTIASESLLIIVWKRPD